MLNYFKNLLGSFEAPGKAITPAYKKSQISACAVFLEAANADDYFSTIEKDALVDILKRTFELSIEETDELIQLANEHRKKSVSLFEFTGTINQSFSKDEKYELLKNLWRILLTDKVLDKFEDHFIRKVTGNLNMAHSDMIAAKMEVKRETQ
ncbi:MAG: TerB family tellurite resistance protein [bacterium]